MKEDRTQPNPDWRTPDDGEECGWGFDYDKGLYKLIYKASTGSVVVVYDDGSGIVDQPATDSA